LFVVVLAACLWSLLEACSSVPLTGRRQFNIIPDGELLSMSSTQYSAFLKEHPLSNDRVQTDLVKKVGGRIQGAVEQYFRSQGNEKELQNYKWEFNLVESKEVNAWCMPGGKVVFYTGILPICQDETGVAVVMGHEVAHAIAKHGAERMSQSLVVQFGGMALGAALQSKPKETQQLWMSAYGLGAQFGVLLPFSRTHESEADRLGLTFMAMAGYDPNAAVGFWQRMAAQGGQKPPEFLSTHPSDETRINDIKKHLPEAMAHYRPG
jgi:predicted Zn-dependent protease